MTNQPVDTVEEANHIDPALMAKIDEATKRATYGCGQSDILYEKMLQDGLQLILDRTPIDQRETVLAALTWHGYNPDYTPYEPEEGECELTGIEIDCCPCGRHD